MIRFFLLLLIYPLVASATEPVSTQGRVNRNAFPLALQRERFTTLVPSVEKDLRARLGEVLVPIRVAPRSWFRSSLGVELNPRDRRTILASVDDTEIWKCNGSICEACPGNESSGCILSAKKAGGVGVVAVIHPCLYGDGKCARGAPTNLKAWLEKSVVGIAYYKAGFRKNSAAFDKANRASSAWIEKTSRSVNEIMAACPGPYSINSLKFLLRLNAVTLPNAANQRCGQKYLETLRALPEKCVALRSSAKTSWMKFRSEHLDPSADILRCDSFCQKMLCRRKETNTIFTLFSGKPTLLIADQACEGKTPIAVGHFIRDALPKALRETVEPSGCLPPMEVHESSGEGSIQTDSGSEVRLIE